MIPASSNPGISFSSAAMLRASDTRHPRAFVPQKTVQPPSPTSQPHHQHALILQFHHLEVPQLRIESLEDGRERTALRSGIA